MRSVVRVVELSSERAVIERVLRPAVHVLFDAGRVTASGRLDPQDGFTLLQIAAVLHAGRADSWGAQPPIPVQRVVIPVLAAIARARGIRPVPA